jgi:ribosomal protein S18 acetylase RimI-like enzyme
MTTIRYQIEPELAVDEFLAVLHRSGLAARRPVDDRDRIVGMLENAAVIVTARDETGLLLGVSRAISDYHYCTYLSDLAVDRAFQKRGIGRELVLRTHAAGGFHTSLILLAAPDAASYYPHIGMQKHDSCWVVPRQSRPIASARPT